MSPPLSEPSSSSQTLYSPSSECKKEAGHDLIDSWLVKGTPRPPSVPACLIPGCRAPVVKNLVTNEWSEYCGEAHMRFVVSSDLTRVLIFILVRPLARLYRITVSVLARHVIRFLDTLAASIVGQLAKEWQRNSVSGGRDGRNGRNGNYNHYFHNHSLQASQFVSSRAAADLW